MRALADFFLNWAGTINQKYHVNPWIFIVIYLLTLPFTWWIFFVLVSKIKQKNAKKAVLWFVMEVFLLSLPYLYIFFFIQNVSLAVRFAALLVLLFTGVMLFRNVNGRANG